MSKEEIEKAKERLQEIKEFWLNYNYATEEGKKSLIEKAEAIEILLQYIQELEQENNKQNKIIDEMTEYLAIIRDCPNEDKDANLDCENRCSNDNDLYTKCWKLYFEKKVEEK